MVEVTRLYHFSAAHCLDNPKLATEENRALYGACHRLHGHNYYLEVTVAGEPDAATGMAADLTHVDTVVQREVLDHVDHQRLESVERLQGVITTGESLARAFWDVLAPALSPARLVRVGVVETAKNRFEYRGDQG